MLKDHYPILQKLITEYEQDRNTLSEDKLIFLYYPQLFVMAIASSFEKDIKETIANLVQSSKALHKLPNLEKIINKNKRSSYIDAIYKEFKTKNDPSDPYNAKDFYEIFGGEPFKNAVKNIFDSEQIIQITDYEEIVTSLEPLRYKDDSCMYTFLANVEILERLKALTFSNSETAFLKLKHRRNIVAHVFISGISDSFEDIKQLFYDAVLYVVALKKALNDLELSN